MGGKDGLNKDQAETWPNIKGLQAQKLPKACTLRLYVRAHTEQRQEQQFGSAHRPAPERGAQAAAFLLFVHSRLRVVSKENEGL